MGGSGSETQESARHNKFLILAAAAVAAVLIGNGCAGVVGAASGKNLLGTSGNPTPGPGNTPQPQLAATPTAVNFSNIIAGASSSQTITVSNSGTKQATISQANVSGAGFSVSGLAMPTYVGAGQSATFSVVFAPNAAGNVSGSISLLSDAPNSPLTIAASGSALAATPGLGSSVSALSFGNVPVGSTNTLIAVLTNTGNVSVTLAGLTATGVGLSASGVAANSVLTPGQTATVSVVYAPAAPGTLSGSVSIASDAPNSPLTITATGNAAPATPVLASTASTLNFGTVIVGSNNAQSATLTNTGTANATISGVVVTGAGFTATGVAANTTLTPGQSASLNVTFMPAATGNVTGSVTISSNAAPVTIALVGTAADASSHSVALTWDPTTSDVIGYNVYRAPADGSAAYQRLNNVPQAETQYTDQNVLSAQSYSYVVTAVTADNVESEYSDPAIADIP